MPSADGQQRSNEDPVVGLSSPHRRQIHSGLAYFFRQEGVQIEVDDLLLHIRVDEFNGQLPQCRENFDGPLKKVTYEFSGTLPLFPQGFFPSRDRLFGEFEGQELYFDFHLSILEMETEKMRLEYTICGSRTIDTRVGTRIRKWKANLDRIQHLIGPLNEILSEKWNGRYHVYLDEKALEGSRPKNHNSPIDIPIQISIRKSDVEYVSESLQASSIFDDKTFPDLIILQFPVKPDQSFGKITRVIESHLSLLWTRNAPDR